ncbi:CBL-interacting protein kinase, partial [Striga asiatica]
KLESYMALCCDDAEQDFFRKIVHLQKVIHLRFVMESDCILSGSFANHVTCLLMIPNPENKFESTGGLRTIVYKPPVFDETDDANLDEVEAVFKDYEEYHVTEKNEEQLAAMNVFELISMSTGLNLGNLFDVEQEDVMSLKGHEFVAQQAEPVSQPPTEGDNNWPICWA